MIDISKYKTIPEFFEGFLKEMNISKSELARKLGKSTTAISFITMKKKPAGIPLLTKMSEIYQLDLNQLLNLKQESSYATDKSTVEGNKKDNIEIEEGHSTEEEITMLSTNSKISFLGEDPDTLALFEKITKLGSEQEKRKLLNELNEIVETRIHNMVPRYNSKDLKEKLLVVEKRWKKSSHLPGYDVESLETEFEINIEGYLELKDSSLFFSMFANNQYLSFTTKHQDRKLITDLLNLVPGIHTCEAKKGKLGKIFMNLPVCCVRIFNPSTLVKDIKILLSNQEVQLNKLIFENCQIEPYFK